MRAVSCPAPQPSLHVGSQVTACPGCGARVRVIAFMTDPDVTAQILGHLGIATEPIAVAPNPRTECLIR